MGFLDLSDDAQRRAEERLRTETVIWLTTVSADGQPQATPVWFVWDGDSFLIYSEPVTRKVENIRARPKVSLQLNSDRVGGDVVIFEATARLAGDAPPADSVPAYFEKYREDIAGLDMTPEGFTSDYAQPIRVVPTRVRAW